MRRTEYYKEALRFLKRVPSKHGRQLLAKIGELAADPNPADSKALTGYPYRRATAGEYRIIYSADDDTLTIVLIGKRNDDDVYRRLGRR
jgi:mRNA interferase RelE/StbE